MKTRSSNELVPQYAVPSLRTMAIALSIVCLGCTGPSKDHPGRDHPGWDQPNEDRSRDELSPASPDLQATETVPEALPPAVPAKDSGGRSPEDVMAIGTQPSWFTPSKELRASLFGVPALKKHFSLTDPRGGSLTLHAQREVSGDWYVALRDGDFDTGGPAASCHIQVMRDPKAGFDLFMPADIAEQAAAASDFLGGDLGDLQASTTHVERLEKMLEGRDDVPAELTAKLNLMRMKSASYHPIPLEWGDEAWAAVFRTDKQSFGNAVLARKGQHVIMLEWRGATLDDSTALLAFVEPHLERLASMQPGEAWVAEWLDEFTMILEPQE